MTRLRVTRVTTTKRSMKQSTRPSTAVTQSHPLPPPQDGSNHDHPLLPILPLFLSMSSAPHPLGPPTALSALHQLLLHLVASRTAGPDGGSILRRPGQEVGSGRLVV
jgi:hypothetical protein